MTRNHRIALAALLIGLASPALADPETGDTGETLATAQNMGNVSSIEGSLIDLGAAAPVDDVDLFQIYLANPTQTTISVTSDLSVDNDSQLFLFDSTGHLLLSDDDSGLGYLPQFDPADFAGLSAGNYYLAISLFYTNPILTGGVLSGWSREPTPFQTGPYTIHIDAPGQGALPEPATWATMLLGFGAIGFAARRRRSGATVRSHA